MEDQKPNYKEYLLSTSSANAIFNKALDDAFKDIEKGGKDDGGKVELETDELLYQLSGPRLSENSTVSLNIAVFDHSYGFDCKRNHNICLIGSNTIVFGSGNLIHFLNLTTLYVTTRRTCKGGGIGCITKNPNPLYNFLTVAENGTNPPIFIYDFPEMNIIRILKNATTKAFSKVDYSSDGELLCSQGEDPDFTLTIWNWKKGEVILRSKSFINDVLNVTFSPSVPGQLTSSGLGHIKFWKMSETFTGLKLQGELGRFGKTEICDIIGIYPMPDEKVLSGSDWGNILVWEDGLIKLEVCRKGRKPCHAGLITQIFMKESEGEVMTIGLDGYARIWFWETVELADPPDTDRFVEIDPMYEYKIGTETHQSQLICLLKRSPLDTDFHWYAQDGNGGIWLSEISPETGKTPKPSEHLLRCHAGEIVAIATSPTSDHFATLGIDGRFHMYDYKSQKLLFYHQFIAKGGDMIWISVTIDPSGLLLALAFRDGVIRIISVDLSTSKSPERIRFIQVLKPHSAGINKISINKKETVFVSGSEDNSIFIHSISKEEPHVVLRPIGLVNVASPPTAFCWKPSFFSTLLVGCKYGEVYELDLPERERSYTEVSYNLSHIELKEMKFKSTKSIIRREEHMRAEDERKERKRLKKMNSLERFKKENPGVPVNEEQFLADSEDEEELEPLFYPKIPNRVLWLQYTPSYTVWLSMAGYDAGYIYEYEFGREDPVSCTIIPEGDDIEIHSFLYFDDYLILGMGDGAVRVNRVNESDFRDLSDYWVFNMHDNRNGVITTMQFSYDSKYLFSAGRDGNVFSYAWNASDQIIRPVLRTDLAVVKKVPDIEDPAVLSLEQQKQKDDYDRRMKIANERKDKVLAVVSQYQLVFDKILEKNNAVLPSQRIPIVDFEIDPRITADLKRQLNDKMNLLKRQTAYDVEKVKLAANKLLYFFIEPLETVPFEVHAIRTDAKVKTFKIGRLDKDFYSYKEDLQDRINKSLARKRYIEEESVESDDERVIDETDEGKAYEEEDSRLKRLESFLYGLSESTVEFRLEVKMKRLLTKYRARKEKEKQRKSEWERVKTEKPDPTANHPEDVKALAEAEKSIGENKLKTDPAYNPPAETKDTTFKKYTELLQIRERIFEIRNNFNKKVMDLRTAKKELQEYVAELERELQEVQLEIPPNQRKTSHIKIVFDVEKEYCEKALDITTIETTPDIKEYKVTKNFAPDPVMMLHIDALGLREEIRLSILNPDFVSARVYTDWELEMREYRRTRKLFEQDNILKKMELRVNAFDEQVVQLFEESIGVDINAKFMETYMLAVNQELWILKDFEKLEDKMFDTIDRLTTEKNELRNERKKFQTHLDMCTKNIERLKDEEKTIVQQFMNNCMNTKFNDFLKKIFKKKYKPPKIRTGNESESSSSSEDASSSSDEGPELDDFDLGNIGNLYLDENVCPPGLAQNIYDMTIDLRNRRYENDRKNMENIKNIENLNTNLNEIQRNMDAVNTKLNSEKNKLEELSRFTQTLLNDVETLVILKMHQLQYFRNQEEFADIENTLLFNNENVNKLYARVGQLAQETMEVERRHKINVMHLARMKTDIKFMEQNIIDLKEEIKETMLKKFGRVVDLDELEETILGRFAHEMRANIDEIKRSYVQKINDLKKECSDKKEVLARVIQRGSEKVQILNVLMEQNNYLSKILDRQEECMHDIKEDVSYREDILKLRDISKSQQEEITRLEKVIKYLGFKNRLPLDPNNVKPEIRYNRDIKAIGGDKGQGVYEEQLYKYVMESVCDSGSSSAAEEHRDTCMDIMNCVKIFINNALGASISEEHSQKLVHFLSRYFVTILPSFTLSNYKEFIPHIRDNLLCFLPEDTSNKVTSSLLEQLLDCILKHFKPELKMDIKDIIKSIVTSSFKAVKPDTRFKPIITQIFKEMMRTFNKEDFNNENIKHIGKCLAELDIEWDTISEIVEEEVILDIQSTNQDTEREFSHSDINSLLHSVINELKLTQ